MIENCDQLTKVFKLTQLAYWWWRPELKGMTPKDLKSIGINPDLWADLPAIQRGFVWNVNQIERLWDSIAQGFPIGSLLLQRQSNIDGKNSPKRYAAPEDAAWIEVAKEKFLILDGQQRATSIASGFIDHWRIKEQQSPDPGGWIGVWVDVGFIPKSSDDRRFLFRANTMSHPWGYAKNTTAGDGPRRISAEEMRNALRVYRVLSKVTPYSAEPGKTTLEKAPRAHEIKPEVAFPWDAEAPVPLVFLLQAILERGISNGVPNTKAIAGAVLLRVRELPILAWANEISPMNDDSAWNDAKKKFCLAEKILQAVADQQLEDRQVAHANALIDGMCAALSNTEIPAPVLAINAINVNEAPQTNLDGSYDKEYEDTVDPAFNLFERINTAGTRLTSEEINYSLLKSEWDEAATIVPNLLSKVQITGPARLVSLLSRLLLTFKVGEKSKQYGLQNTLSIAQFRSEMRRDGGLKHRLKEFSITSDLGASWLLNATWELLTGNDKWSLPPVLAADITKHNEDLMLLLMAWIYRMGQAGRDMGQVSDMAKKNALGFVTALHWFSQDPSRCANEVGKELTICKESDLDSFFRKRIRTLSVSTLPDQSTFQGRAMIPLLNVDSIKKVLESKNANENRDATDLWTLYFSKPTEEIDLISRNSFAVDHDVANNTSYLESAHKFLRNVVEDKRLLLYAQRNIAREWFEWFDPTKIKNVYDHNAPWDFDHILPQSWVANERIYHDVPKMARIWINSNGNFRAWPAECNRKKGNWRLIEDNLMDYSLKDRDAVFEASFIRHQNKWDVLLEINGSHDFWGRANELNLFDQFVGAAIDRTIDIYRCWYESLEISDLQ